MKKKIIAPVLALSIILGNIGGTAASQNISNDNSLKTEIVADAATTNWPYNVVMREKFEAQNNGVTFTFTAPYQYGCRGHVNIELRYCGQTKILQGLVPMKDYSVTFLNTGNKGQWYNCFYRTYGYFKNAKGKYVLRYSPYKSILACSKPQMPTVSVKKSGSQYKISWTTAKTDQYYLQYQYKGHNSTYYTPQWTTFRKAANDTNSYTYIFSKNLDYKIRIMTYRRHKISPVESRLIWCPQETSKYVYLRT